MTSRLPAAWLAALLAALPVTSPGAPARAIATIVSTSGLVRFHPAGEDWRTIQAPYPLRYGDQVKTLSGRLAIEFSDGSIIKLGRLSTFELKPPREQGKRALASRVMHLSAGLVRAFVKPLQSGDEFIVTSPFAVAAVKGTDFAFDGKTVLVFDEGDAERHSVRLSGADREKGGDVGE
ncbi:MAG: FecR domain-containing protein, partial [bacterium]